MGLPHAKIGAAVYRAMNGDDLACIITMVEPDNSVFVTVFPPGAPPQYYSRVKFDRGAGPETAKPGTCYMW